MKRLLILVAVVLATMSAGAQSENYTRQGNTFAAVKTTRSTDVRANADSTKYTWADSKGVERPIWIARTGSCFVIRRSERTGNEYRQYVGREVSAAVCRELGREYKPTNRK